MEGTEAVEGAEASSSTASIREDTEQISRRRETTLWGRTKDPRDSRRAERTKFTCISKLKSKFERYNCKSGGGSSTDTAWDSRKASHPCK